MSHSVERSREKLVADLLERVEYASHKIRGIEDEVHRFLSESIIAEYRHDQFGAFEVGLKISKNVSFNIIVDSRSVINEFRSCLDSLACGLALNNGKSSSGLYFPISSSREVFETDGLKKLRKLKKSDIENIASINPYRGGHPYLFALHSLDITGKHVWPVAASLANSVVINGRIYDFIGPNHSAMVNCSFDGLFFASLEVLPRDLEVGVLQTICRGVTSQHPSISPFVAVIYQEPEEISGIPLIDCLYNFRNSVTETISLFF